MTDKKPKHQTQGMPAFASARLKWKRAAFVVVLAHVALFVGLNRLMLIFSPEPDEPELGALAFQMVAPAGPPPSLPVPRPVEKPPGIVAEQALAQPPTPTPGDQKAQDTPHDFRSDQDGSGQVDLSQRTPRADELPKIGGVAMTLWWGDYTAGTQIGRGAIVLSFPTPDQYLLKMSSEAMGWASLIARKPLNAEAAGTIGPGGFRPSRYTHRTPFGKEEVSVFDYEKEKISYSSLNEPLSLPKGVQDRLSFMLQLAWLLKASPDQFGLGQSVSIPLAGRNKIEDVRFTVMSDQEIVLPGGILVPALHISTFRAGERFKGQIDVWFDKTDRLLPVRIRFEESRGQILDMLTVRE